MHHCPVRLKEKCYYYLSLTNYHKREISNPNSILRIIG